MPRDPWATYRSLTQKDRDCLHNYWLTNKAIGDPVDGSQIDYYACRYPKASLGLVIDGWIDLAPGIHSLGDCFFISEPPQIPDPALPQDSTASVPCVNSFNAALLNPHWSPRYLRKAPKSRYTGVTTRRRNLPYP